MSTRNILNVRRQLKKDLKEGNKLYEKKDFFRALEIYQKIINKYKKHQDFSDVVKEFEERENRALHQLDKKLHGILSKFLRKVYAFEVDKDFQMVIKNCDEFLESTKKYVQIPKFSERFRKVQDVREHAIIQIWEPKYKDLQANLNSMLKNNNNDEAIDLGEEFIEELKIYIEIKEIRIFRQNIYSIINPIIEKKYISRYKKELKQIKELQRKRDYSTAFKRANLFLEETKKYENNKSIEALADKMNKRIEIIKVEKDHAELRDMYDNVSIKVDKARENNDYRGAIDLLVKTRTDVENRGGHSEIFNILTEDIRKYSEELVIIKEMNKLKALANKLKEMGQPNIAMSVSQEAQKLHDYIPMINKHKGSDAAKMLHEVRKFINSLNFEE